MITESRRSGGKSTARAVLITWLITAGWDFVCATLLGVLGYRSTFSRFWQGVASVPFGPSVFQMGSRGIALGLMLHLLVALVWSTLFVVAFNSSVRLRRLVARPAGAFLAACLYGPFIWLVMSLVVIHLATGKMPAFGFRWWVQIFAHIPFVTIPLVFTARRQLVSVR